MQINFILTFFTYLLLCTNILYGQNGAITGLVKVDGTLQEFATVSVSTKPVIGAVSNARGYFILQDLPNGTYTLTASFVGYKKQIQTITLNKNAKKIDVVFNLNESSLTMSAQDLDFSNEATEQLPCKYVGEPMTIGFNAKFFLELLQILQVPEIRLELSDPTKACLLLPDENKENEDLMIFGKKQKWYKKLLRLMSYPALETN